MLHSSAAGEAGILHVCALQYVAGILEPAIKHHLANEILLSAPVPPAAGGATKAASGLGGTFSSGSSCASRARQHRCVLYEGNE